MRSSARKCGTQQANAGCDVKVRYLYQVLRGLPQEMVFASNIVWLRIGAS